MKIKELISEREKTLTSVTKLKSELIWIENQLNDLPFYTEYIEKKTQIMKLEKDLKNSDKEIFETMSTDNLERVQSDNHMYHIKTSTKASIKITNEELLPEEAFKRTVVSKTELGKLILKAKEAWEEFKWAEQTYSKSLEII